MPWIWSTMPPRSRKLVALALLLPGLLAYVLAATVVADALPQHWLVRLVYFVIAGIAWAAPARALIAWAEGRPKSTTSKPNETRP